MQFEQDANQHLPNMMVTHYIMQNILGSLRVENFARSSGISAKLCSEKYTKIASEQEEKMSFLFWMNCGSYYSKDKDGNCFQTEEDEVIELTTEEQL